MNAVRKIANSLEGMFKNLPHLPVELRKTLADYLYIISIALGVWGAVSIFIALGALSIALGFIGAIGGIGWAGVIVIITLIALATSILSTVLYFVAFKPLQLKQEKGWLLLFIIGLLELVGILVALISMNIFSAFWQVVQLAIALYVLYEVRQYFGGKVSDAPKVVAPTKNVVDAQIITKK